MAKAKDTKEKAPKTAEKPAVRKVPSIKPSDKPEVTQDTEAKAKSEPKPELETQKIAKAGKRSAKAIKQIEEKEAKQERKEVAKTEDRPKHVQKPPRLKAERRGKKYREAAKQIDNSKQYSLKEAVELAIKTSPTKFDATVELHVRLGVDPKQADQNIRGNLVLPAGIGKEVRVAVLAEADNAAAAKKAGADQAGLDEILKNLDKGVIDFDVLIATPDLMARLGKYARILGPKGLMPNPKSGTVTKDVTKAVTQAKAGRIEYRVDPTGIIHSGIGKVSFGAQKLQDNVGALLASIKASKPASVKGVFVTSVYLTTTMGPSVRIVTTDAAEA